VVSVSVILARDRLPTAEAWQRAIHELGLPLRLDPDVDPASLEGMWPVTFKGHGTGFEYVVDGDPDPPEGLPDSSTVPDEIRVTLISRSAVESRAAVVAAAALATASEGRVYDDADQRAYDQHEALRWARQVVAEDDPVEGPAHRTAVRRSWTARIRQTVIDRLDRPSVTADWAEDDLLAIKVSTSQLELNISVPRSELGRLERVPSGDCALRIGTILGAPAWWIISRDGGLLFLVAGHDDETWEVGASLPPSTLDAIRAEVAAAVAQG
jgi:hypothetical protein